MVAVVIQVLTQGEYGSPALSPTPAFVLTHSAPCSAETQNTGLRGKCPVLTA